MSVNKVLEKLHNTGECIFNDVPQNKYGVVNERKSFDKYPKYVRDKYTKLN